MLTDTLLLAMLASAKADEASIRGNEADLIKGKQSDRVRTKTSRPEVRG